MLSTEGIARGLSQGQLAVRQIRLENKLGAQQVEVDNFSKQACGLLMKETPFIIEQKINRNTNKISITLILRLISEIQLN